MASSWSFGLQASHWNGDRTADGAPGYFGRSS